MYIEVRVQWTLHIVDISRSTGLRCRVDFRVGCGVVGIGSTSGCMPGGVSTSECGVSLRLGGAVWSNVSFTSVFNVCVTGRGMLS